MYLTCTLLENKLPVKLKTRAAGPDILIEHGKDKIWIEAIAPTSGSQDNPDQVPGLKFGVVTQVPGDQIILRYSSAISAKYENKYYEYLNKGIISPSDSYVIAINSCNIEITTVLPNSEPPLIFKTVFPVGYRKITDDIKTKKRIWNGFEPRYSIKKATGVEIPTDLFLDQKYSKLSGILYSGVGVRKIYNRMGEDFVFIHNPLAGENAIAPGFLKVGVEYIAYEKTSSYEIHSTNWNHIRN